ncbi:M15 family metallopeptidase [Cellulomonas sp. NS3]|uniref:M15 family metallopeptidase n=1 Tax=Cellulomonas sp. NS3 TaxID=2973977 RepID=UPI0021621E14|nr:M15 family metallopeptidase [Cellulomonas sp. NS3]
MTDVPRRRPARPPLAPRPGRPLSPAPARVVPGSAVLADRAGLPHAGTRVRAAVLAVLVVLVLGGGGWPWLTSPAEAGPGSSVSTTAADSRPAGAPADVRSTHAQAARLSAQGAAYARAEHARARATALATLESVESASVHAYPGVDPQLVAQLHGAVAHLARTLQATADAPEPALLGTRAGRAALRGPGGGAVAVSSDAATPAPGGTFGGVAPGGAGIGGAGLGGADVDGADLGGAGRGGAPLTRAGTPDTLELRAQYPTLTRRVEAAAERVALLRSVVEAAARDAAARLDALDALLATAQPPAGLRAPGPATASSGTYLPGGVDPSGDPYPNGAIPLHTLCPLASNPRALLRCDAAAAFDRLAAAYERDLGEPLRVTDSYRTFAAQVAVKAAKPGLAATPGRSNHGRGVAVDLAGFGGVGQFDRPGYLWMKAHAAEHGWYHPRWAGPGGVGPAEPWHWEYGGAPGGVFGALRPARPQDPPVAPPAPVAPAPAPGPVAPPGPVPGPVGPAAPAPGPTTPEPTPTSGPPADPAPPAPEPSDPPADAPADVPAPADAPTGDQQDAGALTAPADGVVAGAGG